MDADTNEEQDIPRYDAWTIARVVGWKHRVAASTCFHSHSVLFERPFTHSSEVYLMERECSMRYTRDELHLWKKIVYGTSISF